MWFYFLCFFVSASGWSIPETVPEQISVFENSTLLTKEAQERIAGGENTQIYNYPYQIQLFTSIGGFCTGAIVSDRYILTAAHCVDDIQTRQVLVKVGDLRRERGTNVRLSKIIVHPEYDNATNDMDIAILMTMDPIQFNRRVQPAILPDEYEELDNTVIVTGWGDDMRGTDSRLTRILNVVTLSVIDNAQCQTQYPMMITNNMFCAEDTNTGGKGACKGDGGAPATMDDIVFGLSSFTRGCGEGMGPSVFTSITAPAVRKFITDHTDM